MTDKKRAGQRTIKPEVIAKNEEKLPERVPKRLPERVLPSRFPWISRLKKRSYVAATDAVKAETEFGEAWIDHERVRGELEDLDSILVADAANRRDEIEITELEGDIRKKELLLRRQQLDQEFARRARVKEEKTDKKKQKRDPVRSAFDRLRASTTSFEDLRKMRTKLSKLVEDDLIDQDAADTFYENVKDDLLNDLHSRK